MTCVPATEAQQRAADRETVEDRILRVTTSARVQVDVTGDIVDRTASLINRDLRTLQGVTIVDSKPDFIIKVMAINTKAVSGRANGVALSYVVLRPSDDPDTVETAFLFALGLLDVKGRQAVRDLLTEREKRLLAVVQSLWKDSVEFRDYGLFVGAPDDLPRLCKELEAAFDIGQLEPKRKQMQELLEQTKKKK